MMKRLCVMFILGGVMFASGVASADAKSQKACKDECMNIWKKEIGGCSVGKPMAVQNCNKGIKDKRDKCEAACK